MAEFATHLKELKEAYAKAVAIIAEEEECSSHAPATVKKNHEKLKVPLFPPAAIPPAPSPFRRRPSRKPPRTSSS